MNPMPAIAGSQRRFTRAGGSGAYARAGRTAFRTASFGAATLLACAAAMAQTQYHIDPVKSRVQFTLGGAHEVKGTFQVSSGDISFDSKTGEMKGSVQVAASGTSDNKSRDKKMRKNQLKVLSFPEITFSPSRFTGALNDPGDSSVQVQGTFTLLGKPHEITVRMTVHIAGNQCRATGSFVVPYVEWGMKDPSFFILREAKEVKVDLRFDGTLSH